ncbi:MAG TPA: hypothetical protein VII99_05735 [Bacteroidia bacterium]
MQASYRKYFRSSSTVKAIRIFAAGYWLAVSCLSFSQIIIAPSNQVSICDPSFSKSFIKKNKIKIITSGIVDKPDGEIIRDKGLAQVYSFDAEGNLTKQYFNEITSLEKTETELPAVYKRGKMIKKPSTKIDFKYQYDTLGTDFSYSSNGYLVMKRVCIGDFFHTTYYEYFGDGLVSRQTLCKETNIAKTGEPFKLGVQTILSDEKFEYENLTPAQVKKKFLNDEGKPYKQGILNFERGRILDESYQFVVGFIRSGVTYKYDLQERLTEKTMTDNSSGSNTEKTTFDYDAKGNLASEKHFKNGVQTDEIVYLYDNISNLLTSKIDRQIQKSSIKIVKYEYEFYP